MFCMLSLTGQIIDYLLEKSRIVHQQMGEKNFHIFYYLFAGMPEERLQYYYLQRNYEHRWLILLTKDCCSPPPKKTNKTKQHPKMEIVLGKRSGFLLNLLSWYLCHASYFSSIRILTCNGFKKMFDDEDDRMSCERKFRELEEVFKKVGFNQDVSIQNSDRKKDFYFLGKRKRCALGNIANIHRTILNPQDEDQRWSAPCVEKTQLWSIFFLQEMAAVYMCLAAVLFLTNIEFVASSVCSSIDDLSYSDGVIIDDEYPLSTGGLFFFFQMDKWNLDIFIGNFLFSSFLLIATVLLLVSFSGCTDGCQWRISFQGPAEQHRHCEWWAKMFTQVMEKKHTKDLKQWTSFLPLLKPHKRVIQIAFQVKSLCRSSVWTKPTMAEMLWPSLCTPVSSAGLYDKSTTT